MIGWQYDRQKDKGGILVNVDQQTLNICCQKSLRSNHWKRCGLYTTFWCSQSDPSVLPPKYSNREMCRDLYQYQPQPQPQPQISSSPLLHVNHNDILSISSTWPPHHLANITLVSMPSYWSFIWSQMGVVSTEVSPSNYLKKLWATIYMNDTQLKPDMLFSHMYPIKIFQMKCMY